MPWAGGQRILGGRPKGTEAGGQKVLRRAVKRILSGWPNDTGGRPKDTEVGGQTIVVIVLLIFDN